VGRNATSAYCVILAPVDFEHGRRVLPLSYRTRRVGYGPGHGAGEGMKR
jgi:hypothetical protein